jgi:serine/threonine-protein kinase
LASGARSAQQCPSDAKGGRGPGASSRARERFGTSDALGLLVDLKTFWRNPSSGESSTLGSTQTGIRFFRERLILICKVFAFIDLIYCALFALALKFDSHASYFALFAETVSLETLGEYLLFGSIVLGCRFFGDSPRGLRVLDALLLLGLGCLWSSWCFIHPYPALGAYEMVLALVGVPVLRAVLIPSSGIRTFCLTAAACVPGLISAYVASSSRGETLMTPATLTVLVANWCSLSVVFSTVASSVVYGLSREVRKARRLGQYTLTAKLGQGGMGVVYLAQHALLRRRTAVKLIGENASPRAIDRFEREVQATSQLTHPNTIAIYDFGRTEDGAFYYAMEHLDGLDLQDIVKLTGPCPPGRVIHILRQACGALEEAHAAGLLHRDIKPSNIFLCPRRGPADVVKLLDFGLVKELRPSSEAPGAQTQVDMLLGTPLYMSPELISDPLHVDARSDLYALGAVAYFLLVGKPLFSGRSPVEICAQHLYATPIPPREASTRAVPLDLEAIVLRCLEKKPNARFCDARSLRQALDACRDAHSWSEDDAGAWWAQHRDALGVQHPLQLPSAPPTLAVDLKQRAALPQRLAAWHEAVS